jgi:hypothetical protein
MCLLIGESWTTVNLRDLIKYTPTVICVGELKTTGDFDQ